MSAKKRTFSKVTAVKSASRAQLGLPKPVRIIVDARTRAASRKAKHKKPPTLFWNWEESPVAA